MKDLDEQMADWRDSVSLQSRAYDLQKITKNLKEFQKLFHKTHSLIDVGCGVGSIYEFLGRPINYIGVDINQEEVRHAQRRFPDARFEVCDLFDLELKADWILCCRVLMHVPSPLKAIETLKRCGRVVLIVPVSTNALAKDSFTGGFTYFRTFSRDTLEQAGSCRIYQHVPYSTVVYDA